MDLFREKILEIFKHDNEKLLRTFIDRQFGENRQKAILDFKHLIESIEGRQRLRLMEIFIDDGGVDLIQLFIETMRRERNLLFAKSLLFIYSNFEHSEALDALLPLEPTLTGELKTAYTRVVGKLKGKFRQKFYMSEFRDGISNQKRMKHAAEMMIKEPHPEYPPFIEKQILMATPVYREKGLTVLSKIGAEESLDAIFKLLPRLLTEQEKVGRFIRYLTDTNPAKFKKLQDYLNALGRTAGWDSEVVEKMSDSVRAGDNKLLLAELRVTFSVNSDMLWEEAHRFLEMILAGETVPDLARRRLLQTFDTWAGNHMTLMELLYIALGEIGHRHQTENLLPRAAAYLDEENPAREVCMAAFLGGYRTSDSLAQLIELLETSESASFQEKVLDALTQYEKQELPSKVIDLANNATEQGLRRKAMDLMVIWAAPDEELDNLLKHESIAVRADAIQLIAEHHLEGGQTRLKGMLSGELPASLVEILIKALAEFPGDETGEALEKFLFPPHPYPIRNAALEGLFRAGGEKRFHIIANALENYPDKKVSEIIGSLLALLEPLYGKEMPPGLLDEQSFWAGVLDDEKHESLRMRALAVLENADWLCGCNYEEWSELFGKALETHEAIRKYDEKRKIRIMVHKVRNYEEQYEKQEKDKLPASSEPKSERLAAILEKMESSAHHDKIRAIRQLNIIFKPTMIEGDPNTEARLVSGITKFIDAYQGAADMLKVAFSLAAKIKSDVLSAKLQEFAGDEDEVVSSASQEALSKMGAANAEAQPAQIEHVFLLDDSLLFTKTLQRFLGKAGFDVKVATNPQDGFGRLRESRFDLLILDYYMPGINGVTFLERARNMKIAPERVIFVTSSRNKDDLNNIIGSGINALLLKPFPVQTLVDKIKEIS